MRFAAEQVGVAQRTADLAIQRFTRRTAEATQGSAELAKTLEQLNIKVTDSAGRMRPTIAILGDLANRIRDAESDAARLRIAFKGFGFRRQYL